MQHLRYYLTNASQNFHTALWKGNECNGSNGDCNIGREGCRYSRIGGRASRLPPTYRLQGPSGVTVLEPLQALRPPPFQCDCARVY